MKKVLQELWQVSAIKSVIDFIADGGFDGESDIVSPAGWKLLQEDYEKEIIIIDLDK